MTSIKNLHALKTIKQSLVIDGETLNKSMATAAVLEGSNAIYEVVWISQSSKVLGREEREQDDEIAIKQIGGSKEVTRTKIAI